MVKLSLPLIASVFLLAIALGYRFYGRWVARYFRLEPQTITPAAAVNDGVDFVPTRPFYLFGQHFSAIAAAGPIAGPILACGQFGWLPCVLWIVLGVIFIGAVHDFAALATSLKHRAQSIAEIVRVNIGRPAWLAIMVFIWVSLVYVIIAFTDITAGTFVGKIDELEGVSVNFERGGAVAAASTLYLTLGILMGLIQRKWNPPLWLMTLIFVPATLGAVWAGTGLASWFIASRPAWGLIILGYCLVSSLLPVWLLLQPRGYLGGFVLYMALAVGTIGIFFGGYEIQQDYFKTWHAPGVNGALFPFLFVTIACGSCSGFHGLVCSGTSSKQIAREPDCRPVGYGAMLMEGFVAIIALATIMILAPAEATGSPGTIYGAGMGRFLTLLIGKEHMLFAITFGAMVFSTFIFDTLDVATRLGRYILQELIGSRRPLTAVLATGVTVGAPAILLLTTPEGGWLSFWILFGTSNQLLAALTLLAVTVWLKKTGRGYLFTLLPMLFVMAMTGWSLIHQAGWTSANGLVSLLLLGLAGLVTIESWRVLRRPSTA